MQFFKNKDNLKIFGSSNKSKIDDFLERGFYEVDKFGKKLITKQKKQQTK